jgi:signal transduction histidine kinase
LTGEGRSWLGRFTNFAAEPVYSVTAFVPNSSWIIFAEVSQAEHDQLSQRAMLILVSLLLVLFVGIFVATTRLLSRSVFTPLETLLASTRQITTENLDYRIPVARLDELGAVTQSFNEMLNRLEAQTDDLRNARDEALRHDRLKSQFLATMSHELRTPLNAIDGYASLILMGIGSKLDPETQDWVERIRVNGKELLGLINNVLDWSRLEANRAQIQVRPVELNKLVKRWEAQIRPLVLARGITFDHSISPAMPPAIHTDDDALTRVILNLLGNAVKFTERGDVTLRVEREGDQYVFQVRDTGIGIPPEAQTMIFEDFRQVDETTTRHYSGSGLGLAIVRRTVELLGGSIHLESQVGVGSTFTVRLPVQPLVSEPPATQ